MLLQGSASFAGLALKAVTNRFPHSLPPTRACRALLDLHPPPRRLPVLKLLPRRYSGARFVVDYGTIRPQHGSIAGDVPVCENASAFPSTETCLENVNGRHVLFSPSSYLPRRSDSGRLRVRPQLPHDEARQRRVRGASQQQRLSFSWGVQPERREHACIFHLCAHMPSLPFRPLSAKTIIWNPTAAGQKFSHGVCNERRKAILPRSGPCTPFHVL